MLLSFLNVNDDVMFSGSMILSCRLDVFGCCRFGVRQAIQFPYNDNNPSAVLGTG